MKRTALALALSALFAPCVPAGVVIEMEVTDSSTEAAIDTIYAEGEMLRVDPHPGGSGGNASMLFREETIWFIDHDKKVCQTIDKDGMEELAAQLGDAMKQMEEALAQVPPEQRAMMEKMMKDRMPGMGQEAAPRRVETGATEQVGEFSCTVQTMFSGDEKVWEVCAADENAAGSVAEAMGAFRQMARFAEQLQQALQQGPFAQMIQTPMLDMHEVEGLPVRVRMFDEGGLTSESTLRSIDERAIEASVFEVPKGYKVKNLADQMKRKKK